MKTNFELKAKPYNDLEKFNFNIEDIERIYRGKDKYCRCGCGGNYAYPEDKSFKRYIKDIQHQLSNDVDIRYGKLTKGMYFNIPIGEEGDNKCFTIYINHEI